ncbi:1,4-alpha-glucan branching protein domain-containing protein [Paenibacillus taiwanensis]|uniref:1,4-alpha-glucan branching protein domain-containing protein n=1 Tax=Paenibacillus taiwanensis TaxID=401638 RepID=UPI0003FDEDC5|nr:1,4-alpha-glucan branching protein domain-containing protein [Paenibacillus taiwanensis]
MTVHREDLLLADQPSPAGYVALVLHAHLPYVRHMHRDDLMEERWFFEAMTETYFPLLECFSRLKQDGIPFRLTMTMTPTLLALMDDPVMQLRYEKHLVHSIKLAELEMERHQEQEQLHALAAMYQTRWSKWLQLYREWEYQIIPRFKAFADEGYLELMTCAATHAYLPFIKNDAVARVQIEFGAAEHERHFGARPNGIWLPECAYSPHLSPMLRESGLRYFIVDEHAISHADPCPVRETLAPVQTYDNVYAFCRDAASSHQVWSSHEGYPGDPQYREYYRDIGYDLGWHDLEEWAYIKPYLLSDGARINTGIKYYRITGAGSHKELYNEQAAQARAYEHARHFLHSRLSHVMHTNKLDRPPILLCPYDAELFGHWWYEGPIWIEALFRELHHQQQTKGCNIAFISPVDYIALHPDAQQVELPCSSWGRGGYAEVWLQERNDWVYKHLHQAEDRLLDMISKQQRQLWGFRSVQERLCNQSIRELLLAESSDWAFIIDADTVPSYASQRTKEHIMRCHLLLDMLEQGVYDEVALYEMEQAIDCFPTIDYQVLLQLYKRQVQCSTSHMTIASLTEQICPSLPNRFPLSSWKRSRTTSKCVLMLAWEFPPLVVGGLSRAVYDLSRHLARHQCEVHVITREVPGSPSTEWMHGVMVHRAPLPTPVAPIGFMDWVLQLNAAMCDRVDELIQDGLHVDFVHAHDWLVYLAAKDLKDTYQFPLIATIHATEHGRNNGTLHSSVQHRIHETERQLVHAAEHVIVCSQAMVQEVEQLFDIKRSAVSMIPNGVECAWQPAALAGSGKDHITLSPSLSFRRERSNHLQAFRAQYAAPDERVLFFIGRLVYEKGIQVLLQALPLVKQHVSNIKLIIAGTGPMLNELKRQVHEMNLTDSVCLAGFVQDEVRENLFQIADLCIFPSLYEPFGIVALEAMGHGIPVVVSDTGGLAEIIDHGRDGFKALPGHVESLAWHVTELLQNEALARRYAVEAMRKVRTMYDWDSIAVSTRQVYEGVIA